MKHDDSTNDLLAKIRSGDRAALGALLEGERMRLLRMLALRIDGRLRSRVDPADVVQDSFLEAARRIDEYLNDSSVPFYVWLRFLVLQRLNATYREHLGAQMRDARREVRIDEEYRTDASSEALAAQLLGRASTPSQSVSRMELRNHIRQALDSLASADREMIALRHFERLSNGEAAHILGLDESAASKRYIRAMSRLRQVLTRIPDMVDYPWK